MNSWLMRNVAAQLAAGKRPAEFGWRGYELCAGSAVSSAQVTGWGSRPTFQMHGPASFFPARPTPPPGAIDSDQ